MAGGESDRFYEVERLLRAEEPADSFKGEGGNDKRRQGLRARGRAASGLRKEKAAGALRQNEACPGSGQTDAAESSGFCSRPGE